MLPDSPRERLEWAITEASILFGIFLFWAGVVAAVVVLANLLTLPFLLFDLPIVTPPGLATSSAWTIVLWMTAVTSTLYVLVRAGGLLIEQYHRAGQ